jgi:LTXXQ motif family protein
MRPPRLVLVSTVLVSALIANDAQARPRLPGVFGAMLGTMGGMMGLRHHSARGHQAPRVASAPAQTATDSPAQPNTATAAPMAASAPVFWPQLADDVFDYILWPSGKDDRLWVYGYDDLVQGALRPPGREGASRRGRGRGRGTSLASGAADTPATCAGQQGGESGGALIERIEQTIQPTDEQRSKLNELRVAFQRAFEYIDKACPADRPQTPTARLDAMEDRIWAGRQALLVMRAPLEQLYASLNDEQKARLNGPLVWSTPRGAGCRESKVDLPRVLMGGRARPEPTQRPAIEALTKTSAGLARLLTTSCPAAMPPTPVERLDAADKRLNSMLYTVVTLRAPLDGFYSSLTEEQKTRLGALRR